MKKILSENNSYTLYKAEKWMPVSRTWHEVAILSSVEDLEEYINKCNHNEYLKGRLPRKYRIKTCFVSNQTFDLE
jgi:hypothetical protein